MKNSLTILLIMLSFTINAQPIDVVTLQDGSVIQINADFTWQYVTISKAVNSQPHSPFLKQTEDLQPINAKPLPLKKRTQNNSANKHGIAVKLIKMQWVNNRLGLTFELLNNSDENYVVIALEIDIFSDTGDLLKSTVVNVWQASFRLPDTYLRANEIRQSRIIWIDGIDKEQWQKQSLNLTIKEMNYR